MCGLTGLLCMNLNGRWLIKPTRFKNTWRCWCWLETWQWIMNAHTPQHSLCCITSCVIYQRLILQCSWSMQQDRGTDRRLLTGTEVLSLVVFSKHHGKLLLNLLSVSTRGGLWVSEPCAQPSWFSPLWLFYCANTSSAEEKRKSLLLIF